MNVALKVSLCIRCVALFRATDICYNITKILNDIAAIRGSTEICVYIQNFASRRLDLEVGLDGF